MPDTHSSVKSRRKRRWVSSSLSLSLWLHVFVYQYFHQFFLFIFSSSFVISLLRFLHLHFSLLYRSIFFIFRSFKTANKFFLFQASFLLFQKLTLAIKCHYKRLSKRITINHVSLASRIKLRPRQFEFILTLLY